MEKEEKLKGLKTMQGEGDYSCTSPQEEIKKLREEYDSLKPITDERIRLTLSQKFNCYRDEPDYANPYVPVYFAVKNLNFDPETYVEGDGCIENKQKRYKCILKHTINYQPCILSSIMDNRQRSFDTKENFNKIKQFILIAKKYGYEVIDILIELNREEEWEFYNEEEFFKEDKKENVKTETNHNMSYTPKEETEQEDNLENAEEVIDGTKYDFLQIIHRLISIKDSINELRKKYCPDSDYDFPAIVNEKGNKISIDDGIWLIKVFEEITDYLLDYENELYRALDKNEKLRDMNYRYLKGVITSANLSFHSFTDSFKNWDDVEREERREPIHKYIKDYVAYLDESKERAEKGFDIVFGEKLN